MLIFGGKPKRCHGRVLDAHEPHEVIEIGAVLSAKLAGELFPRDWEVAEYLGQASGKEAPAQIHLPESLLGVQIALSEEQIFLIAGVGVRDAVSSPAYFDFVS